MNKILVFSFIFIVTLQSFSAIQKGELKISSNKVETITIINKQGDIEISEWNEDFILIKYEKYIKGIAPKFKNIDIKVTEGEEVNVETIFKKKYKNAKVDFYISIPSTIKLSELHSFNGDLTISNISNSLTGKTNNGSIKANNINGITNLSTNNGKIEALGIKKLSKLESSNGNIKAEIIDILDNGAQITTSNGNIELDISFNLSSNLEVRDSSKSIKIKDDNSKKLNASTSNGHVEVTVIK